MEHQAVEQLLDWVRNHYFGKYRGTVTDNSDSTNRGRVKVRVPAVLGDLETWAMPCLPYAGDNVGVYMIPESGAGVWVEFEGGDPSYPIWTGGFWGDNELPQDKDGTAATTSLRIIRSQQGLMLALDDDAEVITISDSNGNNIITIDSQQSEIKIHGTMKTVVDAPLIELVENSTHPLVFGDNLLEYLTELVTIMQTHVHPGEMALGVFPVTPAPPVTPFPMPTPDLLSVQVTTG
jgi:Type VI secretion system/phage-baseplate injector OB domain